MVPGSYLRFNYALRPAKQVERRLLVEALLRLSSFDYAIHDYTYLGFGSVYYADFQLFNRYLYMDRMICVEGGSIAKRMAFNKPFGSIDLRLGMLGDVIPSLDRDRRYFAWPDFDVPLTGEVLADVRSLSSMLSPGSLLLVTVDAEARVRFSHPLDKRSRAEIVADHAQDIDAHIGRYLDSPFTEADYDNARLPTAYATALQNAIGDEVIKRGDVEYCQLFNFRYKDGAQMLSLGGLLDTPERTERLRNSPFMEWPHLNPGRDPVEIAVPPLTPLERQRLDRWATEDPPKEPLPFELADEHLEGFARYRRYYPQYFESLT